jgi:acyl-coenzyme A thioesterase PaaI-like protein
MTPWAGGELSAAGAPGKLYGEGRAVHRGRDVVFVERLEDGGGRVIATATATTRIIPFADRGSGAPERA